MRRSRSQDAGPASLPSRRPTGPPPHRRLPASRGPRSCRSGIPHASSSRQPPRPDLLLALGIAATPLAHLNPQRHRRTLAGKILEATEIPAVPARRSITAVGTDTRPLPDPVRRQRSSVRPELMIRIKSPGAHSCFARVRETCRGRRADQGPKPGLRDRPNSVALGGPCALAWH